MYKKMSELQDFSDPSVKTLHFQGKDHEFSLWSEDYDTTCPMMCKKFFKKISTTLWCEAFLEKVKKVKNP